MILGELGGDRGPPTMHEAACPGYDEDLITIWALEMASCGTGVTLASLRTRVEVTRKRVSNRLVEREDNSNWRPNQGSRYTEGTDDCMGPAVPIESVKMGSCSHLVVARWSCTPFKGNKTR